MPDDLDWARDATGWPNTYASRFVEAGGLHWHVQIAGHGPRLLLLHGTGASTHSWAGLLPLLAARFRLVAPDLPGHGFTAGASSRALTLPGMAQAVGDLLATLDETPALAIGHSAGAAVLVRMCLDRRIAPRALVSLNGALLPLDGVPGRFFSPIAKLLALSPLVPRLFAWRAGDPQLVRRMLHDTGSKLTAEGIGHYARLARSPRHVAGALGMMANWDLAPLERELRGLPQRLVLVACAEDHMVSPVQALRVRRLVPQAEIVRLKALGHLGHEEDPERFAEIVERVAVEEELLATA